MTLLSTSDYLRDYEFMKFGAISDGGDVGL